MWWATVLTLTLGWELSNKALTLYAKWLVGMTLFSNLFQIKY